MLHDVLLLLLYQGSVLFNCALPYTQTRKLERTALSPKQVVLFTFLREKFCAAWQGLGEAGAA